jgi:SAM-dependent methyltransferase
MTIKENVKDFWEEASCGETQYLKGFGKEDYLNHSKQRYELEPEILEFGEFHRFKGLKTLEIGVGLGADHQKLAEAGAILDGIDLTPRAISHTTRRLEFMGLNSNIKQADAENLPFENDSFDAVYSYGVIHHSPNTPKITDEIYRILSPGGFAKIMIYHKYSLVGYMLWIRYALMRFKPFTPLTEIYNKFLESPGTKAYTIEEAKQLFGKFTCISANSHQTHGDLLTSDAGQRHRGILLKIAKLIWPRWFFKTFMPTHGLSLLIEVKKEKSQ